MTIRNATEQSGVTSIVFDIYFVQLFI